MFKEIRMKVVSVLVVLSLIISLFPVTGSAHSNTNTEIGESGEIISTLKFENNISENLEVKIVEEKGRTLYETYLNGEFIDRTITYPNSDEMLFEDKDGNVEMLNINDYVTTTSTLEPLYSPPSSYTLYQQEYSNAWGQWGYLYGKLSVVNGPTKVMVFSAGTAVSTIIGVIGAVFSGGIGGILLALGATIIGAAIDTAISGEVYTRTRKYNYEVISQNKLGLRTYTEDIDARVINKKTGAVEWVDLRVDGDTRSRSDMIHAGIYNVAIGL